MTRIHRATEVGEYEQGIPLEASAEVHKLRCDFGFEAGGDGNPYPCAEDGGKVYWHHPKPEPYEDFSARGPAAPVTEATPPHDHRYFSLARIHNLADSAPAGNSRPTNHGTMTSREQKHLQQLLTTFDAAGLGEGDLDAGANLLAAMAITLANLAGPGSGLRTKEGRLIPVGCNLLASGPLVTSMILDEVVTPVGRCQDNLLAQLSQLVEDDKAEEARGERNLPRRWELSKGAEASSGENAVFRLMINGPDAERLIGSEEDDWVEAVTRAPSQRPGDLIRRPRCYIAAPTPRLLEGQLSDAHLGQALVVIGLDRATDATAFGDLCPALMDGLLPAGPSGQTVRGRLLVTDSSGVLQGAATVTGDKANWLERLLPLVDGGAGPDFPQPPAEGGRIVRLPDLTGRFEHAVRLLFANRLNSHEPQPDEYDLSKLQPRWMSFLSDMERSLPGITGTARRLLASLLFGLRRLVGAAKAPEGFKYYCDGVEALARHLVCRAANARTATLRAAELAERQSQIERIFWKLKAAQGRIQTRAIYRNVRQLSAADCRESLEWMEAARLACRVEADTWELIEGARLDFDQCTVPLLGA